MGGDSQLRHFTFDGYVALPGPEAAYQELTAASPT